MQQIIVLCVMYCNVTKLQRCTVGSLGYYKGALHSQADYYY